ncbi:MAG: hypothetical protein GXP05_04270 [Alphaproteobacteria bacterium]|nr:hypothetical protein [Alphaproteobacteria bacterium]
MTDRCAVEFGLGCVAMAMRAKLGVLGCGEAMDLIKSATALVPGDESAALAVAEFAKRCQLDQSTAGAALHDFILGWRGGCIHHVSNHFAWQERADLA